MGSKYTVQAWGRHFAPHNEEYSYMVQWAGQSLLGGLWNLWRIKRSGTFGCVTLECR